MKIAFITERPTQAITATIISLNNKSARSITIYVANCFNDAKGITQRLSEVHKDLTYIHSDSYNSAFESAISKRPDVLFIHWDVGFRTQNILKRVKKENPTIKISVFEEGIGTYRQDIYPRLKKLLFQICKLPINIGGSRHTDEIYVYNVNQYEYNATKKPISIKPIPKKLDEYITSNIKNLSYIFNFSDFLDSLNKSPDENCFIYLSNWNFHIEEINKFKCLDGALVLKLHPHCQVQIKDEKIYIAPSSVPAEVLIILASQIFSRVTVYHNNSSTEMYINNKNIEFIDLSNM